MPALISILLLASAETETWLAALRQTSVEDVLWPLLVQLTLIVLVARLFGVLLRRLGQPTVIGEIVAGLVLGPSVFGRLFPAAFQFVFHPRVGGLDAELSDALLGWILTSLSQLGLIFLLFLIGLEFDFSHLRERGQAALSISLAGIALPFALGFGLAQLIHSQVAADVAPLGFALFLGTALSITAVPVLGRIMLELGITRTPLGAITISAAALDDAVGWILLASIAAVVRSAFDPLDTLFMAAQTVAFALVMTFLVRPVLRPVVRRMLRGGELDLNALALLLAVLFLCALATNRIGIFAVFGAFFLGAILSGDEAFRQAVNRRLSDFVSVFFLPLYFAYTGLRTDIGSLHSWQLWLIAAAVSAMAVLGKFGGCAVAAWMSRYRWREAACIGALMNTRGLMALVVINLGKDLGVVPASVYCMLILMALVTTLVTTPLVLWLMPGTELEPAIRDAGFGRKNHAEPNGKKMRAKIDSSNSMT
jgi:Kef-type K+ transport system membrane component KefB